MFKARNLFVVGFLGVVGAVSLPACMAGAEVDAVSDETFVRTIVHLNEDGTEVVTVETITLQEQLAELEEEELSRQGGYEGLGTARNAIVVDSSCASSSMRLWDRIGYTGNQICFTGNGTADFSNYCRQWLIGPSGAPICISRWGASVKSYQSGSTYGVFWKSHDSMRWCSDRCPMFYSNTSTSPASACEQSGVELQLGPVTCRVLNPLSMQPELVDVQ